MNFTYYYFCSCGYDKVVHVHENQKIYHCATCFNIEGKESQDDFFIECQVCGETKQLQGDVSFGEEMVCSSCAVKGSIGLDESHQFLLQQKANSAETCSQCRKNNWQELADDIPCPFCFQLLKVKMSDYWEDEKK